MCTIQGIVKTIEADTGNTVKVETTTWGILPTASDKCQFCARDHPPREPHDAQSLYYQMAFKGAQGRWPTWADAIAHCEEPVRKAWRGHLTALKAWTEPEELEPIAHFGASPLIKDTENAAGEEDSRA